MTEANIFEFQSAIVGLPVEEQFRALATASKLKTLKSEELCVLAIRTVDKLIAATEEAMAAGDNNLKQEAIRAHHAFRFLLNQLSPKEVDVVKRRVMSREAS
jgi:hypothetical protein